MEDFDEFDDNLNENEFTLHSTFSNSFYKEISTLMIILVMT